MLYRKVPKTGEKISILGFGAMRLPMIDDKTIDEERAIAQIRNCIDNGVNYVDTAWPYHGGQSEIVLGKALKDGYRPKVAIADKLPQYIVESREHMDEILDEQLRRLDVDCIDYYLIHAVEGNSWDRCVELGVKDFMDKALESGKIKYAGFSFHGVAEDFKRIVDDYPWTFCQIQYNFLDTENQAGNSGLKYAASKDLAVMIMEPLRGGNLSAPTPPDGVQEIFDEADVKRAPVEWALRWVWNHPEVTVVLSGMNDEEHIKQNLAIASEAKADSLTEKELEIVSKVAARYKKLMQVPCTGCAYCMPCPAGVRIPGCFELFNSAHMFTDKAEQFKFQYAVFFSKEMAGEYAYGSQCVECGQCVEHCPQHIDIPEQLKRVVDYFEQGDMQAMVDMVANKQEN
ncbi:aldo/keto reductase [Desulfovibrio sp. JC010]|uniref:aldo/keto reductase n=1 Tax=Desulfovibrio sp. JC010 TaxID=2593641 RepID=UPI0013D45D1B|nr:aldo/keto reductase [Desulfovibrio sp. JC010]NDV26801.1 aldo/keto reductase [Desulfovibrio sp. JC010]